ncbi:Lar family restriction alleviation protein [Bradyrhizobium sp. GM0.4]
MSGDDHFIRTDNDEMGLLPCPFCGGEADRQDIEAIDGDDNPGGSYIECTACGACTQIHYGRKENLIDSWNSRKWHLSEQQQFSDAASVTEDEFEEFLYNSCGYMNEEKSRDAARAILQRFRLSHISKTGRAFMSETAADCLHDAVNRNRIAWTDLTMRVASSEGISRDAAAEQVLGLIERRVVTMPVAVALIEMIVEKAPAVRQGK